MAFERYILRERVRLPAPGKKKPGGWQWTVPALSGEETLWCVVLEKDSSTTGYIPFGDYQQVLDAVLPIIPATAERCRLGDELVFADEEENAVFIAGVLARDDAVLLLDETGKHGKPLLSFSDFGYEGEGSSRRLLYRGEVSDEYAQYMSRNYLALATGNLGDIPEIVGRAVLGDEYEATLDVIGGPLEGMVAPFVEKERIERAFQVQGDGGGSRAFPYCSLKCLEGHPEAQDVVALADEVKGIAEIWAAFVGEDGKPGPISGWGSFEKAAYEAGIDIIVQSWREGIPLEVLLGR